MKTQMSRYIEKTQEILTIIHAENIKNISQNKTKELTSTRRDTIDYTYTFAKLNFAEDPDMDDLYNNLNKIRDIVRERQNGGNFVNIKAQPETSSEGTIAPKEPCSSVHLHLGQSNVMSKEDVAKGVASFIEKVPRLIPEEFFEKCHGCTMNFGVCRWKYHCRCCGYVFCFYCSWNYDNFLPFYLQAVRICERCVTDKKNLFYVNI